MGGPEVPGCLFQLFFIQLLVGLIQQVRGGRGVSGGPPPSPVWGWPRLQPPPLLQWMVPTIQNSMKPFRVSEPPGLGTPPRWGHRRLGDTHRGSSCPPRPPAWPWRGRGGRAQDGAHCCVTPRDSPARPPVPACPPFVLLSPPIPHLSPCPPLVPRFSPVPACPTLSPCPHLFLHVPLSLHVPHLFPCPLPVPLSSACPRLRLSPTYPPVPACPSLVPLSSTCPLLVTLSSTYPSLVPLSPPVPQLFCCLSPCPPLVPLPVPLSLCPPCPLPALAGALGQG